MNVKLTVPVETMQHVSTIMDPMYVTVQKDGRDMIAKMVMINNVIIKRIPALDVVLCSKKCKELFK